MTITITGEITNVMPIKTGISKKGNEWASQSYVIKDENGDKLVFEVFGQDKIDNYNLTAGTRASVTVKVESSEWNGKWFTKVSCTECISGNAPKQQNVVEKDNKPTTQVSQPQKQRTDDVSANDLPF